MADLSNLERMAYPGRLISLGLDENGELLIAAYAVTGRSSGSKARKIIADGDVLKVTSLEPEKLTEQQRQLLEYDSFVPFSGGIMISNGKQTDVAAGDAEDAFKREVDIDPKKFLSDVFSVPRKVNGIDVSTHEPDAPIYTPRITGMLTNTGHQSFHIAYKEGDGVVKMPYHFKLDWGKGMLLPTYDAEAVKNPMDQPVAFTREPLEIRLGKYNRETAAGDVAEQFYAAMKPAQGQDDFRVAVAVMVMDRFTKHKYFHIINACDRKAA